MSKNLRLFSNRYDGTLIVKSDSSNAIAWVFKWKTNHWKFHFHLDEIVELSIGINVSFRHEVRSANSIANVLAKQEVDRLLPWVGVIM